MVSSGQKRFFIRILLSSLVWIVLMTCSTEAAARTIWPRGAKAAVVLTYDDALQSQLDNVVPVLNAANFKATFFLSNVQAKDVARWKAVAANGHELGNHTIFHACSKDTFPADPRYTSEAYTPASILKEIAQQNVLLTALDGRSQHGFATPCGGSKAGGQDYLADLRQANLVTYVRGSTETAADLSANVAEIDPMQIPSRGFRESDPLSTLTDFIEQAELGGGWAVFHFHGVGGDYLEVSEATHHSLIDWLAAHRRDVWVTTLQSAIDWAKTHPGKDK